MTSPRKPKKEAETRSLLNQRYLPLHRIGAGGMGEVLLAHQTGEAGFRRTVALKRIHRRLTAHPAAVRMFLDEARLAAALCHSNIVQIFDVGQEGESFFIVMEYVDGTDLRKLAEGATRMGQMIPMDISIGILLQVLEGLRYAHTFIDEEAQVSTVVHGDIGPNNILVSRFGGVKLVDFGLAAAEGQMRKEGSLHAGKFAYMAPETIFGLPADARTDLFSIGILLWELTVGQRLFRVNSFESLRRVLMEPIPPPTFNRPNYPPDLEIIVMRALELNPDDRYPTAEAMLEDLERFAFNFNFRLSRLRLGRYVDQILSNAEAAAVSEPEKPAPIKEDPTLAELAEDLNFDRSLLFEPEEEDSTFDEIVRQEGFQEEEPTPRDDPPRGRTAEAVPSEGAAVLSPVLEAMRQASEAMAELRAADPEDHEGPSDGPDADGKRPGSGWDALNQEAATVGERRLERVAEASPSSRITDQDLADLARRRGEGAILSSEGLNRAVTGEFVAVRLRSTPALETNLPPAPGGEVATASESWDVEEATGRMAARPEPPVGEDGIDQEPRNSEDMESLDFSQPLPWDSDEPTPRMAMGMEREGSDDEGLMIPVTDDLVEEEIAIESGVRPPPPPEEALLSSGGFHDSELEAALNAIILERTPVADVPVTGPLPLGSHPQEPSTPPRPAEPSLDLLEAMAELGLRGGVVSRPATIPAPRSEAPTDPDLVEPAWDEPLGVRPWTGLGEETPPSERASTDGHEAQEAGPDEGSGPRLEPEQARSASELEEPGDIDEPGTSLHEPGDRTDGMRDPAPDAEMPSDGPWSLAQPSVASTEDRAVAIDAARDQAAAASDSKPDPVDLAGAKPAGRASRLAPGIGSGIRRLALRRRAPSRPAQSRTRTGRGRAPRSAKVSSPRSRRRRASRPMASSSSRRGPRIARRPRRRAT